MKNTTVTYSIVLDIEHAAKVMGPDYGRVVMIKHHLTKDRTFSSESVAREAIAAFCTKKELPTSIFYLVETTTTRRRI